MKMNHSVYNQSWQASDRSDVEEFESSAQKIKFAVNCAGKDKDWNHELLATQFKDIDGSVNDVIEHVLNGHALCAGTLNNRRRNKSNVVGSHWVLVDIDNSQSVNGEKIYKHQLTLEEALEHPFVKQHCALIYTTASHKPDWHKFRLIFLFPHFVEGADVVEQAIRLLLEQFPHDPACKDASRVFYGSSKAEIPLVNRDATLPSDWIERAEQSAEQLKLETERRLKEIAESREKYQQIATGEGWDTDALIEQALSYIPPRNPGSNNYQECTQVLMALVNYYGTAQAEVIGERWSPSIKGDTWDVGKKIRSYKRDGVSIGTLFYIAKQHGFRFPAPKNKFSTVRAMSGNQDKRVSVTGDSASSGDTRNGDRISVSATVTSVTEVLKLGLKDYEERHELDAIAAISIMSEKAFKALIAATRFDLDDVTPEDEIKLGNLIDWHNSALDFRKALPKRLADDVLHDADVLNVDPVVIWQPLMTAIHSLAGRKIEIDVEAYAIPSISWTVTVLESGGGKTRADKLVFAPLKEFQSRARNRYKEEKKLYDEWDKESGEEKPELPIERKYLFEIGTIQAVLKRMSEQGEHGQVWNRDEIAGLFKSLGQFNKGDNEGLEILLKLWDGSPIQNDRVRQEDSYFTDETALSINGGIQPGVFREIFKDPSDSQGLLARFLIAAPKVRKMKRTSGYCFLAETLPQMYAWLDSLPSSTIKLSKAADRCYTHLYNEIGEQAYQQSNPGIRAWMCKLPSQLLRIALALHLVECYYEHGRNISEIQKDTLERAVLFAQYYRSAFHVVQEVTTNSDEMSSILLKIWDAALTKHPDGITPRDAYRNVKAINNRAKDAGRDTNAYTIDLFHKLEEMGKGTVKKVGRVIKFVAEPSPTKPTPTIENQKILDAVTVVTVPENDTQQALEGVTENRVSPVTVQKNGDLLDDSLPSETNKEAQFDAKANAELMISCLGEENGADQLTELSKCWTETQKAEVRLILHEQGKLAAVRELMRSSVAPAQVEPPISDKAPENPPKKECAENVPAQQDSAKTPEVSVPTSTQRAKFCQDYNESEMNQVELQNEPAPVSSTEKLKGFAVGTRVKLDNPKDSNVGTVTQNVPEHGLARVKWDYGAEKVASISGLKAVENDKPQSSKQHISDVIGGALDVLIH